MLCEQFKIDDRVEYTYEHFLNSKSSTYITKTGTFEGTIKHTKRYSGHQLACVQFDGNKRQSKVYLYKLKLVKKWQGLCITRDLVTEFVTNVLTHKTRTCPKW